VVEIEGGRVRVGIVLCAYHITALSESAVTCGVAGVYIVAGPGYDPVADVLYNGLIIILAL
jgi:hypothetical protein